jgi:hypothetical protein
MRLYVNSNNQWFGNQDDANAAKSPYELCVVPDDKKGLITFLNNFKASTEVDAPEDIVLLPWKEERNQKISDDQMASIGVAIHNKNHPAPAKGMIRKQVICYLEYNPAIDEVVDVRMVSNEQFAADNFPAWDKLDQELTEERKES